MVITCPMFAGEKTRRTVIPLKLLANLTIADRLAITNVHEGVVVIEVLSVGLRQRLMWNALVVRLASFHPTFLFAPSDADATRPAPYNVPAWPLVSAPLGSGDALPAYSVSDDVLHSMGTWTL